MESQQIEKEQKEVKLPNFQEIFTQNNLTNNQDESQQNLVKADENKQLTIQENESMVHTPTESKEHIPLFPYLDEKLNMSKVYPITYKQGQQDIIEQDEDQKSYDQKKQEIKDKLEKINTGKDEDDDYSYIEECNHDEGLSLANELFKLQKNRKVGKYTIDNTLIQNEQILEQQISTKDNQIDYDLQKWKQLMERDIERQQINEQVPNLEELKKIKNIELVSNQDFFETYKLTDKWEQLKHQDGKVIKYADCQKYKNIICLFVSSYYKLSNNEKYITYVETYRIDLSPYLSSQKLKKTGQFMFQNELKQREDILIADINIKFQKDSIHFIQYYDGKNKIFKYTEDNEYGQIELINDKLNIKPNIKLNFMINISDTYDDNYQYLYGQYLKEEGLFIYKYSDLQLEIIREIDNFPPLNVLLFEKISESLIDFYCLFYLFELIEICKTNYPISL